MADNYRVLEEKNDSIWFEGSPIIICATRLELDTTHGKLYTSAKFLNIQPDNLRSLTFDVICYDENRNAIDYVTGVTFSGLDVQRNADFGYNRRIPVNDINTRGVEYVLRRVTNIYNQTWENDEHKRFDQKIEQRSIYDVQGDYNKQFLEICTRSGIDGTMLVLEPQFEKSHWLCACGGFNWNDERICAQCRVGRAWLEKNTSLEVLEKQKAFQLNEAQKIKQQIQEKARLADNQKGEKDEFAQRKKEYEKQQKKQKTKKIVKRSMLVIFGLAAAAAITYAMIVFVIPYFRYSNAVREMNSGQYDSAISAFEDLGDFMDSKSHIVEAKYGKASDLFRNREYDEAIDLFNSISDYSDSEERISEVYYEKACSLMNSHKFKDAIEEFKKTDYKDSKGKIDECLELLNKDAETEFEDAEYKSAYDNYMLLDEYGYKGAKEKANECMYLLAKNDYENMRYFSAVNEYNKIPEYKDTAKLLEKYENLSHIISTATEKRAADWVLKNVKCPGCDSNNAEYHIRFSVDGKMSCYYECTHQLAKIDEKSYLYKIEDNNIYKKNENGKGNWQIFAEIKKMKQTESGSYRLTITSPIEKGETATFSVKVG